MREVFPIACFMILYLYTHDSTDIIRFTQIFKVLITVFGHRKETSNTFPKYTINTKNDGKK